MISLLRAIEDGRAESSIVLLPNRLALNRLRKDIVDKLGGVFGLRMATMRGFLEELATGLPDVPQSFPDTVAEEAIGNIASKLSHPVLSRLLRQPSVQRASLYSIRELKLAGINREQLASSGNKKLRAVCDLWHRYDELCNKNQMLDPIDRELLTIQNVERNNVELEGVTYIWVAGFPYLQPHYQRFLKALGGTYRLHLYLPSDGGSTDLFASNERFLREVEGWSSRHTAEPQDITDGDGLVGELQKAVFASSRSVLTSDPERIAIATAPRRFDEVEASVFRIQQLLRKDIPPGEMGITIRNLAHYDQFIRDVFERHRIPYYYRRGIPLLQSSPVRLAMRMTEIAQPGRPLRFEKLLGFVTSVFLNIQHNDLIRSAILQSRIYSDHPENWSALIVNSLNRIDKQEFSSEAVRAAKAEIRELLDRCINLWKKPEPLGQLRKLAEDRIILPGEQTRDSDGLYQGWRQFLGILEDLSTQYAKVKDFGLKHTVHPIERLRERIRNETMRPHGFADDAVQILNFYDMGYVKVDHLFVLGLDERTVPAPSFQNNRILSESDIQELRRLDIAGSGFLKDSEQIREEEAQAFLLAVCSARSELHLYYPAIDNDGRETTPSPFLAEIMRILGVEDREPARLPGADLRTISQVPPEPLALRRQLTRRLFRPDLTDRDELVPPTFNLLLQRESERSQLENLFRIKGIEDARFDALFSPPQLRVKKSNRYCGRIEDGGIKESILRKFGSAYYWSASSLEMYGNCPFHFFIKYCLGLEEFQLPTEEPLPLDEGLVMHEIVNEFVEQSTYPIQDLNEAIKLMNSIVEEHFAKRCPKIEWSTGPTGIRLFKEKVGRLMTNFVRYEVTEVRDRRPLTTELSFGKGESVCEITLPNRKIRLEGRFDRMDRFLENEERLLVIDYKRTGKSIGYKPSIKGHSMQMPLYLLAAAQLFGSDLGELEAAIFDLRKTKLHGLKPTQANQHGDWPYFFGISETKSERYKKHDYPAARLTDLLDEIVGQILNAYFPVEGRNGAQVPEPANLVGRWLEIPPEFEQSEAE